MVVDYKTIERVETYGLENYHNPNFNQGERLAAVSVWKSPTGVVIRQLWQGYGSEPIAILETTAGTVTLTLLKGWTADTHTVDAVMEFAAQYAGVRGLNPYEFRALFEKRPAGEVLEVVK